VLFEDLDSEILEKEIAMLLPPEFCDIISKY
jgi:hypothetical protein